MARVWSSQRSRQGEVLVDAVAIEVVEKRARLERIPALEMGGVNRVHIEGGPPRDRVFDGDGMGTLLVGVG
jgi:hypothetical protein